MVLINRCWIGWRTYLDLIPVLFLILLGMFSSKKSERANIEISRNEDVVNLWLTRKATHPAWMRG
jgi:hypothetical protein